LFLLTLFSYSSLGMAASVADEWRRKSADCYTRSQDSIVSVISQGFEVMTRILECPSNYDLVLRSLQSLENARLYSLQIDRLRDSEDRQLIYGVFQCIYLVLGQMNNERNDWRKFIESWNKN
ncbi:hypothetical protein PMAYCL1PPCAC_07856, partial [Pristionchus mayeri]